MNYQAKLTRRQFGLLVAAAPAAIATAPAYLSADRVVKFLTEAKVTSSKTLGVGITSTLPSGNTARTSRARIASLTFSRMRGRRGGKFLDGIIEMKTRESQALGTQKAD